ncbi:MAG: heavy-metal-associated domain-containing protein [Anaerolineales bacterium]|nr:heavy-metal-associated domain-containing protein [Anaerolineales bacterium]MCB9126943.1 heavy-metal-associated domain-containing protein [Ardenticatenales bacterium]MCB9171488.1 heavy-metal-associated domain-containing protein [Ardenticatenales bacterium]
MTERTFTAPDISCGHCTRTIERELGELEGVRHVQADVDSKAVTVQWVAPADWPTIAALLEEIGYPPAR